MAKKKVTISHKEMLDTLQTIHLLRQDYDNRAEVDDSEFLGAILYEILSKMHTDETNCIVELDQQERFAVWLCLDNYREFTIQENQSDEQIRVESTMNKFK